MIINIKYDLSINYIFYSENIVIYPSQESRHQDMGQVQITKVIKDENPLPFILDLLNQLKFPTWFALDFHGFMITNDGGIKFEFASRNSGIRFFDEGIPDIFLHSANEIKRLKKFLESMSSNDLQMNWFKSHNDVTFGNESGFSPGRLLATVIYIEPLANTVEEIFGSAT